MVSTFLIWLKKKHFLLGLKTPRRQFQTNHISMMASLGYINRKYDEKKFGKTNWICQDSRLKTYHLKPIVSVFFFSLYMSLKNNVVWCQILKKFMLIKADYVCTIWHTFLIKNCCMGILFSILYLCCKLSDIYMFKLIGFITVGGIWHLPSLVNLVALVQQWQFYLQWFM